MGQRGVPGQTGEADAPEDFDVLVVKPITQDAEVLVAELLGIYIRAAPPDE